MTKAFALKNSMKAFFQGVILKKPTKLVRQLLQFNYILKHSSFRLRLADIYTDAALLKKAGEEADRILKEDPDLSSDANRKLREAIRYGDQGKIGRTI